MISRGMLTRQGMYGPAHGSGPTEGPAGAQVMGRGHGGGPHVGTHELTGGGHAGGRHFTTLGPQGMGTGTHKGAHRLGLHFLRGSTNISSVLKGRATTDPMSPTV